MQLFISIPVVHFLAIVQPLRGSCYLMWLLNVLDESKIFEQRRSASASLSVRLFVRPPRNTRLPLDVFREFVYWGFLLKSVDDIQIWLRSGENYRHFK